MGKQQWSTFRKSPAGLCGDQFPVRLPDGHQWPLSGLGGNGLGRRRYGQQCPHRGADGTSGRRNPVKLGGIGNIATKVEWRNRGYATAGLKVAQDFLRDPLQVDFGLMIATREMVTRY